MLFPFRSYDSCYKQILKGEIIGSTGNKQRSKCSYFKQNTRNVNNKKMYLINNNNKLCKLQFLQWTSFFKCYASFKNIFLYGLQYIFFRVEVTFIWNIHWQKYCFYKIYIIVKLFKKYSWPIWLDLRFTFYGPLM